MKCTHDAHHAGEEALGSEQGTVRCSRRPHQMICEGFKGFEGKAPEWIPIKQEKIGMYLCIPTGKIVHAVWIALCIIGYVALWPLFYV